MPNRGSSEVAKQLAADSNYLARHLPVLFAPSETLTLLLELIRNGFYDEYQPREEHPALRMGRILSDRGVSLMKQKEETNAGKSKSTTKD